MKLNKNYLKKRKHKWILDEFLLSPWSNSKRFAKDIYFTRGKNDKEEMLKKFYDPTLKPPTEELGEEDEIGQEFIVLNKIKLL